MVDFRPVSHEHVLTAIEEYDALGGDALLAAHDAERPRDHTLTHRGRIYDAKVVAGLAYMRATRAAASPDELFRGRHSAAVVLRELGFEVSVPAPPEPQRVRRSPAARSSRSTTGAARPASTRAATTPRARAQAVTDRPVRTCPTCFLALPATGICDDCD